MNEPKFLKEIKNPKKVIDYESLLRDGISLIQKFSGNKWTDYNFHDPGITILEQLCYALTDLGYRSNFKVEDLLLLNKDNFDIKNSNLLFPLNEILPTSPLTINDFRKFIIERVENIKNVWIEQINDNSLGLNGLLSVSIQCSEDITDEETTHTRDKVHELLMHNRLISTDFENIRILKKEKIEISAIIKLDPFSLGESVLAEIYYKVDKLLNPEIIFYDYDQMIELGYTEIEIFSGVETKLGFIDSKSLTQKTNSIYFGEIKELIDGITGVSEIEEIRIFKNGVQIFDDLITFSENSYPSLKKTILNYNEEQEKIVFQRNDSVYGIDSVILSQLYDSLTTDSKSTYKKTKNQFLKDSTARFEKSEIENYYSIQNELPSIYGLKKNELPKNAKKKRVAQVKQLRGFLYFFEQLMANYLSQLANLREFFSINNKNTFFNQLPSEIADLEQLAPNADLNELKKILDFTSGIHEKLKNKKNQILDHLLARFNEDFDTSILSKVESMNDDNFKEESMLDLKIKYAQNILQLGKEINKGFNYSKPYKNNINISGLETRLKLLLGVKNIEMNSLCKSVMDSINNSNEDVNWRKQSLKIKGGIEIDILSQPKNKYKSNEVSFFSDDEKSFRSLFLFATKEKSYKIVETISSKDLKFSLLYNSPLINKPIKIYQGKTQELCLNMINRSINKFKKLNHSSEGIYLIEHLLLRPSQIINYKNFIYDDEKNLMFESYETSGFEIQKDIRSDLLINAVNKNNYLIKKNENSTKFKVLLNDLFGNPILISKKEFGSEPKAEDFINEMTKFFKIKKQNRIQTSEISDLRMDLNKENEFPSYFQYSNKISLVCPDWPGRFQNTEFISYLKSNIKKFIPLHVNFDLFILNINEMSIFEKTYFNWLSSKSKKKSNIDKLSIQMIQLISSYKKQI